MGFVVASDPDAMVASLHVAVPLAAAFVVMSFGVGWFVAAAVGPDRGDRFTLASEFATRNIPVATVVAVTLGGRVELAMFATTYLLTEIPLLMAAIWLFRVIPRQSG